MQFRLPAPEWILCGASFFQLFSSHTTNFQLGMICAWLKQAWKQYYLYTGTWGSKCRASRQKWPSVQFSSVTQSCPTLCDPMNRSTPGLRPSPTPGVYSNSCPSSWWYHPPISSSVVPFSSCPQSLQASGSLPMSQLFTWSGQSIGVSASALVLGMYLRVLATKEKQNEAKRQVSAA